MNEPITIEKLRELRDFARANHFRGNYIIRVPPWRAKELLALGLNPYTPVGPDDIVLNGGWTEAQLAGLDGPDAP